MGGFGLPFPTSNNAPLPVPGGYGNPTGANFGGFGQTTGQPFPTMPAMGGPVYNQGSYGTGQGLAGLSSGLFTTGPGGTPYAQNLYNMLGKGYGKGTGQVLGDILSKGLFNPQVAAAFLNAQQPGIARGQADILGAFGDAGARFSSAAALGLGDYQSQVQLNQQQMLASLFENAQQQELGLLQNVLPTIQQERANEGGWLNKVLGGIETIGGIAAAPLTGGASLALTGAGLGMLTGNKGGGQSQVAGLSSLSKLFSPKGEMDMSGLSMSPLGGAGNMNAIQQIINNMQTSGGGVLGGETLGIPTDLFGGAGADPSLSGFPF